MCVGFFQFSYWFWGAGGKIERKTLICYSTYLYVHWLLLVCSLTRDWTCNLNISGQCSTTELPGQGIPHVFECLVMYHINGLPSVVCVKMDFRGKVRVGGCLLLLWRFHTWLSLGQLANILGHVASHTFWMGIVLETWDLYTWEDWI